MRRPSPPAPLHQVERGDSRVRGNDVFGPPWSPAAQGDGRNMLRPYGLTRTYPSQRSEPG